MASQSPQNPRPGVGLPSTTPFGGVDGGVPWPGASEERLLLVFEKQVELSAAVGRELRDRQPRAEQQAVVDYRTHVGRRPTERSDATICCQSAGSVQQILHLVESDRVTGLILDLRQLERESLVLLRHLQTVAACPSLIATGHVSHEELLAVLLEAGCSALLTELPCDRQLADWVERLMDNFSA